MGAQLWFEQAPWHADPEVALQAVQARCLEQYDLSQLLPQHLAWAREAVTATKAEGDPYDLLEQYEDRVRLLEGFGSQPIPEDTSAQIEIVRHVHADSGAGVGNILDITGISTQRGIFTAQRLTDTELVQLVRTSRPTAKQADGAIDNICLGLDRGECVCFPVYEDDTDSAAPVGWYFVGNTVD
jgi:hypothetical protein